MGARSKIWEAPWMMNLVAEMNFATPSVVRNERLQKWLPSWKKPRLLQIKLREAKKLAIAEKQEVSDRAAELHTMYHNLQVAKRKAEGDFHALQEEIEELESEKSAAEDRANKAGSEIARVMADLAASQEALSMADKSKHLMAKQVAEAVARAEAAESSGGKGLKNQIRKLEARIVELESDVDTEARKASEAIKVGRKAEKQAKELTFQLEDEHKAVERANDASEKLNAKMKKMRLQLEEAELAASK